MRSVLFVCTGNTCRSAMAEVMFRKMLDDRGIHGITVSSAGITAFPGDPASEGAVVVMAEKGIDLTAHLARHLTPDIIGAAGLILTMTRSQEAYVINKLPQFADRVHTLGVFALDDPDALDIQDPYGADILGYKECAAQIEDCLTRIFDRRKVK